MCTGVHWGFRDGMGFGFAFGNWALRLLLVVTHTCLCWTSGPNGSRGGGGPWAVGWGRDVLSAGTTGVLMAQAKHRAHGPLRGEVPQTCGCEVNHESRRIPQLQGCCCLQACTAGRPENCFAGGGGWHGRPAKEGGGVPEMGFRAGPFVLWKDGCCHQRRRNTNFGPEKFFSPKKFPPHMCQNVSK